MKIIVKEAYNRFNDESNKPHNNTPSVMSLRISKAATINKQFKEMQPMTNKTRNNTIGP